MIIRLGMYIHCSQHFSFPELVSELVHCLLLLSRNPTSYIYSCVCYIYLYRAPTHAGGLFAMDRKYFFELGAYDDGLLIWGGENFELSFKVWCLSFSFPYHVLI